VNTVATRRAVNSNFCLNCVQVSERVVSHFRFRPTIRRCILTEERMDKISGLEASPRFLA
jgi:hypothetical protein